VSAGSGGTEGLGIAPVSDNVLCANCEPMRDVGWLVGPATTSTVAVRFYCLETVGIPNTIVLPAHSAETRVSLPKTHYAL
jgi:hypothetical protein